MQFETEIHPGTGEATFKVVLTPQEADKLAFVLGDVAAKDTELDDFIDHAFNTFADLADACGEFGHQRISEEGELRIQL